MAGVEEPRRPFTRIDPYSHSRTLAQRLAGRRLVDPLRNLLTRFGLRHYEVRVIRIQWSGDARGEGDAYVRRNLLLEPTPRVRDIGSLNESIEGPGVQEMGQITVDRISTAYSDAHLRGLEPGETQFPRECEAFWEITFFGDKSAVRRRFNLVGAPGRKTLGWECRLERALGDRDAERRDLPPGERLELPL